MIINTADFGVAGMARRTWSLPAVVATPAHTAVGAHAADAAAAIAAQRKRRANAAPTIASVDRSFI
jgi:hypothetical protein